MNKQHRKVSRKNLDSYEEDSRHYFKQKKSAVKQQHSKRVDQILRSRDFEKLAKLDDYI